MAAPAPSPSAQFLREPELRRGMELLYFGHSHLIRTADQTLGEHGLGRAHHRALYFVARRPDLTVSDLLGLLSITKQSLGRVLTELTDRGLVETRAGERDRRQRLLRLTEAGRAMESDLFEGVRQRMAAAYAQAGQLDRAEATWSALLAKAPADTPWRPEVEARLRDLRARAQMPQ